MPFILCWGLEFIIDNNVGAKLQVVYNAPLLVHHVCVCVYVCVQDRFTRHHNHIIKHYGRKYDKQITILVQNEIIAWSQKAWKHGTACVPDKTLSPLTQVTMDKQISKGVRSIVLPIYAALLFARITTDGLRARYYSNDCV